MCKKCPQVTLVVKLIIFCNFKALHIFQNWLGEIKRRNKGTKVCILHTTILLQDQSSFSISQNKKFYGLYWDIELEYFIKVWVKKNRLSQKLKIPNPGLYNAAVLLIFAIFWLLTVLVSWGCLIFSNHCRNCIVIWIE